MIINPHSKKIKKFKTDPVEYYKKIGGNSVDIILTQTLDDITNAAKEFKKQEISYLVISGGDGSIHHVISRFIKVYKNSKLPHVLILRDGSMNNIARSYNLKGRGHDLLKRLVNAVNNNDKISIVYRNTININDMYCFMFGLGITANFINEFNKGGNKSPLKAVKTILKGIFIAIFKENNEGLFKRTKLKVFVDGKELWFNDFFGVLALTIANLPIGFKPAPRAYENENAFHLLASGLKPYEFLLRINKFRTGKPIKHKYHYDNIASEIKMMCQEKFLYQMDGDVYEADRELSVRMGPRIGFVSV